MALAQGLTAFRQMIVTAVLLVGSAASAAPLVVYSAEQVQLGGVATKALVPHTVEGAAGTAAERAMSALSALRAAKPELYKGVELTVAPDFETSGQATLSTGDLAGESLDAVVGEVYASLSVHGLLALRVSALGDAPVGPERLVLPVFAPVVQAWEALPPRSYTGALVQANEVGVLTSADFYDRLHKGDKALQSAVLKSLDGPVPAAQVRVLSALGELGVPDAASLALPLLTSSDREVKLAAIDALAPHKSDARVTEALAKVVEADADPDVKSAAVKVLVAAGVSKYKDYLLFDKLKDPNEGVVIDAVRKLVASKNPGVAPALASVLDHPTVDVREEALAGIISLGNTDAMELALGGEKASPEAKIRLAKALTGASKDEAAVRGLIFLLASGEPGDAAKAAEVLGQRKATTSVQPLIAALGSSDAGVRKAAATALGAIGDGAAIEPLAALLGGPDKAEVAVVEQAAIGILEGLPQAQVAERVKSENATVRQLAVRALSKFAADGKNPAVMAILKEQLRSKDQGTRRAAAYALARVKDESVANELLALKGDSDAEVRAQVATALGWSKNPGAADGLIELLGDSDSTVKEAAAKSVEAQGFHKALDTLLQYVQYGRPEVRRAVMAAVVAVAAPEDNERLLDVFQSALYDQDPEVKLKAIAGISRIKDPRSVTGLSGVVIDPNTAVQKAAIEALSQTKDPNATEAIARALFSDSREMKLLAIKALGVLAQQNAMKPLQEFIKNEGDEELRNEAMKVYDSL